MQDNLLALFPYIIRKRKGNITSEMERKMCFMTERDRYYAVPFVIFFVSYT